MYQEIWDLEGRIYVNLKLIDSPHNTNNFFHPAIRHFSLKPQYNEKGSQIGEFDIKISFLVESDDPDVEGSVADSARDIFDYIVNYLTFLSGKKVRVIKPYILKFKYPDQENKYKCISSDYEYTAISPPLPFDGTYLSREPIDYKLTRSLSFYSYGISEPNIITSTYFLLSSLETLAALVPCDEKVKRKCKQCNFEEELQASTKLPSENRELNISGGFLSFDFEPSQA